MRFLVAFFMCCAFAGYSQEETPAEITVADEGESSEVANVDSIRNYEGCGCPKKGDTKPK